MNLALEQNGVVTQNFPNGWQEIAKLDKNGGLVFEIYDATKVIYKSKYGMFNEVVTLQKPAEQAASEIASVKTLRRNFKRDDKTAVMVERDNIAPVLTAGYRIQDSNVLVFEQKHVPGNKFSGDLLFDRHEFVRCFSLFDISGIRPLNITGKELFEISFRYYDGGYGYGILDRNYNPIVLDLYMLRVEKGGKVTIYDRREPGHESNKTIKYVLDKYKDEKELLGNRLHEYRARDEK